MKTEDGFDVFYEETYYAVYYKNHEVFINTEQERELFKVYECIIHYKASINTFGMKLFKIKENAENYCKEKTSS